MSSSLSSLTTRKFLGCKYSRSLMRHLLNVYRLPGVPPTNIKAEVPFTAVVNIRGDRLYHEHISWDQGTLLRQLGLLPEYLPFPYALPDGRTADGGFEYRVPVAGKETAVKVRDRHGVGSNQMFSYEVRERQT